MRDNTWRLITLVLVLLFSFLISYIVSLLQQFPLFFFLEDNLSADDLLNSVQTFLFSLILPILWWMVLHHRMIVPYLAAIVFAMPLAGFLNTTLIADYAGGSFACLFIALAINLAAVVLFRYVWFNPSLRALRTLIFSLALSTLFTVIMSVLNSAIGFSSIPTDEGFSYNFSTLYFFQTMLILTLSTAFGMNITEHLIGLLGTKYGYTPLERFAPESLFDDDEEDDDL